MYIFIKEVKTLLGSQAKALPLIIFLFLFLAVVELASIGLMAPYVAFIANPEVSGGSLGAVINVFKIFVEADMLLPVIGICLFILYTIKSLSGIFISYYIVNFSMRQQTFLRERVMKAHQSIKYEKYLSLNSADFLYDMQILIPRFSDNVLFFGLKAISSLFVAIAISALLFFVNSAAFISMIGVFGLFAFIYYRFFRVKAKEFGILANLSAANMVKGVNESNEGMKEIRVLGNEKYFFDVVKENSIKFGKYITKTTVMSLMPRYLLEVMLISFLVIFVVIQNQAKGSLETIVLFATAGVRLVPIVNEIMSTFLQFRISRDAVSRLYKNLNKQNSSTSRKLKIIQRNDLLFKSIKLDNVDFSYPNSNYPALSGINLEINSGESIGFIGASGSGKTTLIDIMLGLLTPKKGSVTLNNRLLQEQVQSWHENVAYLPQEVFLVDNTLACNIALGVDSNDIDYSKLKLAISKANLTDLVERLPEGLETRLGERGARISGGQRQRVALARAFYFERSVLIMDEATSALDTATEFEINEEIKLLKGTITIIVIAHRLTTVKSCDRIYNMERGRIVSLGSSKEILDN
jgi:ATP-binding cassette, subfamily B, bacterial PglK